ncbi:hypothetical protein ANN_27186 [Periplaneta americana]|uniref:Mos1 transposase HTH domain-containing protein n=1 Tax=Periplaneta americana TaxID=6978 RepID=A0ABQ8RXC0_PERAM|nr:hypothetical protein ANN_27186 [Periplaneta americana]
MFKVIDHPADCEMRPGIRFLNARNIKPADIHHQLCEVYGDDAISDRMVRRWVRKFNEGCISVHDEQHTGRPSLINDDLVHAVDEKIHEDRRFTISSLSLNFPQMLRSGSQVGEFYNEGIERLVPRLDKCLNNGGDYEVGIMKVLYKEYYRLNFGGTKTTTVLKPNTYIIGLLTVLSDQWYPSSDIFIDDVLCGCAVGGQELVWKQMIVTHTDHKLRSLSTSVAMNDRYHPQNNHRIVAVGGRAQLTHYCNVGDTHLHTTLFINAQNVHHPVLNNGVISFVLDSSEDFSTVDRPTCCSISFFHGFSCCWTHLVGDLFAPTKRSNLEITQETGAAKISREEYHRAAGTTMNGAMYADFLDNMLYQLLSDGPLAVVDWTRRTPNLLTYLQMTSSYTRCVQQQGKTELEQPVGLSGVLKFTEQPRMSKEGDETRVSHITHESKQQFMEWRHTASPVKKKFKQTTSTRKIMCTVFWDRQGVLLISPPVTICISKSSSSSAYRVRGGSPVLVFIRKIFWHPS